MYTKMTNEDLLKIYTGKRGMIASEMCKRAGTLAYLLEHCTDSDRNFNSCMRDTIEVLQKYPKGIDKITGVISV